MEKIEILSANSHLPNNIVSSIDLFDEIKSDNQYGISRSWMSEEMGVIERRMSDFGATPSSIAIPAAENALKQSGLKPEEVEMVIFCGIERDHPEPATAHTIANYLGINAKRTFDISNACFGFVDGLETACDRIAGGKVQNALIVTSEMFSRPVTKLIGQLKKGVNVNEAKKYIGFLSLGDAGGAVVLAPSSDGKKGFEGFNIKTLSDEVKRCHYHIDESGTFCGQMQMGHLSALMIKGHNQIVDETLDMLNWKEYDFLLSHQIGKAPFDRLSGIRCQKTVQHIKTYDKLGNIASATFPVNFEKLLNSGKFKPGSKIMGMYAGSGLVYGQLGYSM